VDQWQRFWWWLQHDQSAPAVIIQALTSLITVVLTATLCWVTYQYMQLTRTLARTAQDQLRASLRPSIEVWEEFGGAQDSTGQEIFRDRVFVLIKNTGHSPLLVTKVTADWDHTPGQRVESEILDFRNIVLNAEKGKGYNLIMIVNGKIPVVPHFELWSKIGFGNGALFRLKWYVADDLPV
jgi:hypothetical protein